MFKKLISLVVTAAMVVTMSTTAFAFKNVTKAAPDPHMEKFTLTYATTSLGVTNDGSATDKVLKDTVAYYESAFKKLYPNATLQLFNLPGNKYEDLFKAKYASGTLEDVIHMNVSNIKSYMKAGLLVDLSGQPWVKNALPAAKITCTYGGKWYTSPESTTVQGVFYNKKLFKLAGISGAPKTWSALLKDCELLKAKGITPFIGGFKDNWVLGMTFQNGIMASFMGTKAHPNISIDYYNGTKKVGGPEMKDALQKFSLLITKGYFNKDCLSIGWDQSRPAFAQGQGAMLFQGSWLPGMLPAENPMDLGFFPIPNANGTQLLTAVVDSHWGVNAKTKHLQAAKDLVNIMASKKGIQVRSNNTQLCGYKGYDIKQNIPVMLDVAKQLDSTGTVGAQLDYTPTSVQNKISLEILTKLAAGQPLQDSDMTDLQKLFVQDKSTVVPPGK